MACLKSSHFFLPEHLEILNSAFRQNACYLQVGTLQIFHSFLPRQLETLQSAFKQDVYHLKDGLHKVFQFLPSQFETTQSAFKECAHHLQVNVLHIFHFFSPRQLEIFHGALKHLLIISRLVYSKFSTLSCLDTLRSPKVHSNSLLTSPGWCIASLPLFLTWTL